MYGKKDWFFPDTQLPPAGGDPELFGHESYMVLNPNDVDATVDMVLYFTDRDPMKLPPFEVKAGRVICVRAKENEGLLGYDLPVDVQYAVSLHASAPIVAMYGRLDMRSGPMAFYSHPGYAE